MKFLHLADLHLGKKVFGYDLDEEQRDILRQVLEAADTYHVDGVLICGDVYDVAMPPIGAVALLNWFLNELHKRALDVFIISGNHDSAGRLNFGSELLKESRIHIASIFEGDVEYVDMEKDGERVRIHMLPFIKPIIVRTVCDVPCDGWNAAMEEAMKRVHFDDEACNILMSHQFFAGSQTCESETHAIGTLDQIATSYLDRFDYAALGHLHNPQSCGRAQNRYPGTLLKFSASELDVSKTLTMIETNPDHSVSIIELPLHPIHDFVRIRGTFDEIVSRSFWKDLDLENYYYVILDDEQEVFQVYEKLTSIYPRLLKIEYSRTRPQVTMEDMDDLTTEQKTPMEIFAEFFEMQNGTAATQEQMKVVIDAWEAIHETD